MIIITETSDLEHLLSRDGFYRGKIKIQHRELNNEDLVFWQTKLNSFGNECGCSMGMKLMLIFEGTYLVIIFLWSHLMQVSNVTLILIGLLVFILSTLIGKLLGLTIAKLNFKTAVRQLHSLLNRDI